MADKLATMFGVEIENKCPCGEDMKPYDSPQMVVWHKHNNRWARMCGKCITNGACFQDVAPANESELAVVTRNPSPQFVPTPGTGRLQLV